jgi:hypothetical protein
MPSPKKFPQFSKMPQEIRDDDLRRSVAGLSVNFITVTKTQADGETSTSLVRGGLDGDGAWDWLSARTWLQEIAAACPDGYHAVMHFIHSLQNRVGSTVQHDSLLVLVPQQGADDLDAPRSPPYHDINNGQYWPGADDLNVPQFRPFPDIDNGQYWPLLPPTDAVAFLWQPFFGHRQEFRRLWSRNFPEGLKVLCLVDMERKLRLDADQFKALKIRAGPWYGGQVAFVDLQPNPIHSLPEYLGDYSEPDVINMMQEVNSVEASIWLARELGPRILPTIEVRILTAVYL